MGRRLCAVVCFAIVPAFGLVAAQVPATPPGSAELGRAVFEGKADCFSCHRVRTKGSRLGPDLTDIGLRAPAEELQRALVDPEADVLPHNRFYRVVTREGTVITGRLLNHDTFSVQIMDAQERLLAFEKADLVEYGFVKGSTMPSYRDKLTPEELRNLVAYLASLKGIGQ